MDHAFSKIYKDEVHMHKNVSSEDLNPTRKMLYNAVTPHHVTLPKGCSPTSCHVVVNVLKE